MFERRKISADLDGDELNKEQEKNIFITIGKKVS